MQSYRTQRLSSQPARLFFQNPRVSWVKSNEVHLSGRNGTYQLNRSDHESQSIWSQMLVSYIQSVSTTLEIPAFLYKIQSFPVQMLGEANSPPSQDYHFDHIRDGGSIYYPSITIIHYVVVENVIGGDLYYETEGEKERVISPEEDTVYAFEKLGRHRVGPLISGNRCSIITNLY